MPATSPRTARRALLGVDLTAAGARPGAHGALGAVAARAFDGERLARLVHRADRGLLDLVVLGDGLLLHPGRRQVAGRLDAAVAAARVAPLVRTAALVAGVPHRGVDPAHLAGAIRGVQGAAGGPVGWQLSGPATAEDPLDEHAWATRAAEAVEQVRAAWAAGEPGAVRRDDDGRFRVDHDGIRFAVRGRTAGGRGAGRTRPDADAGKRPDDAGLPLVVVPVAGPAAEDLAGRYADLARLTAPDLESAAAARARIRAAAVAAGRSPDAVRVLLDVDVALADDRASATARLDLVRAVEQPDLGVTGAVLAGTGADLATVLADAVRDGAVDGFVARPTSAETDLAVLVERTVPALQQSGAFRLRPGAEDVPARTRTRTAAPTPAPTSTPTEAGAWSAAPFALT
ncbi:LLM class flavin-dependent oxidoreductase [Cellulomonas triticagri]|uniref:LLM class flavin-dependent oxidoreductase n=1 Tax=Cellulomonas triticagri TaxID=2483352 RepID=A0A3M2J5J7_9CELL|nr:LLM class flavin-dependent oxidoreductase [Cellulomonas triticagri]RMI06803.1 LLM class flavin-dependent oxidoreductase [Cellulomonas triticagri]